MEEKEMKEYIQKVCNDRNKQGTKIILMFIIPGFLIDLLIVLLSIGIENGIIVRNAFTQSLHYFVFMPTLLSLLIGVIWYITKQKKRLTGVTEGTVIKCEFKKMLLTRRNRYRIIPIVEYNIDGVLYKLVSHREGITKYGVGEKYITGETVKIIYDPTKPENAKIKYTLKQKITLDNWNYARLIPILVLYLLYLLLELIVK